MDKKKQAEAPKPREWNPRERYLTSVQMSLETRQVLCDQHRKLGCSRADVIEMAIRRMAEVYGVNT